MKDMFPLLCRHVPDSETANHLQMWYGGMVPARFRRRPAP